MTQSELVDHLNRTFGTGLTYLPMTVEEYREDRIEKLGDFMGTVIAGIYEGIRLGAHDAPSDFATVAGGPHQEWDDYFASPAVTRLGSIR